MRIVALMIAMVTACHHKPAPAPAPAPPAEQKPSADPALARDIADGFIEVLATMATITETAEDCPVMATRLLELFEKSTALFDLARTQGADPEAGPLLKTELDNRAAAVAPLVDRITRGLERCKMDPDVAAAMERMPTL